MVTAVEVIAVMGERVMVPALVVVISVMVAVKVEEAAGQLVAHVLVKLVMVS